MAGSALGGRANEGHGEGKRSTGAGIFGTVPGADQWMEWGGYDIEA